MKRALITLVSVAVLLGVSSEASAWHWVLPFAEGPWHGAGGNYYTGSPRSFGITCASCHVGSTSLPPNQRPQLSVSVRRVQGGSLVADDIFANGYQLGERYKITVTTTEHKGRRLDNGQYEDPTGSTHKVQCPLSVDNVNILTAEVMNENEVYAGVDGGPAGTLRGDRNNDPNSTQEETRCLVAVPGCGGSNVDYPARTLNGGPTTVSHRNMRLVDPNSNPPFGNYQCTVCDSVVSMYGADITPSTSQAFPQRQEHFFWTAPTVEPPGNGRIRFYMAYVDGDGYTDAYDDGLVEFRRAICPSTNSSCNPTNPTWNFTEMPVPVGTRPLGGPTEPPTMIIFVLLAAFLVLLALYLGGARSRRVAMIGGGAALLLATAAMASGCVNVKAWERGRLASLCMTRGPDVEEAMIERTFLESREGSSGGSAAAAGGGCACN